jgi:hypothetical protein
MPRSRSTRLSASGWNSLKPLKSIWATAGRSSTSTTRTSPSASRRTSLKKPVAYSARSACWAVSWVSLSPTLTGK